VGVKPIELKDRFYHSGMQLADCLRLMGKHDECRQVELWVLALCREIESNNVRSKK
jgi:hypothetical protein